MGRTASFLRCKMSKDHAELKGVVKCTVLRVGRIVPLAQERSHVIIPFAPVVYQVFLKPGIGQFREFEPRRVHTRINSSGLVLVHDLTCGKREGVS